MLISATSETAVSQQQQQPKVETQQTSSSSHEEKVLDDGTVVQMSSSSARKTSSSSQEMTIPISFGQLTRQTSQAKTPRYEPFFKSYILLTSSNNQISEFRIPNIYNEILFILFFA